MYYYGINGRVFMEFIEPKNIKEKKVNWTVSECTEAIVSAYALYTGYSESEIVDKFLKNLAKDENFKGWVDKKRNNKRFKRLLDIMDK